MLTLHGVCDQIRAAMATATCSRIGCLLTGIELFPGNIQGGSDTPAGWASGLSIDQEIKNFLQKAPASRTRFGSLEFGVMVPDRADTWTRMIYAGGNKPIAPVDDPYQMFHKLYGRSKDREALKSILDDVQDDLEESAPSSAPEDRHLLDEHATFVREMEELRESSGATTSATAVPEVEPGVESDGNDQIPKISKMQIDLMVNSFARRLRPGGDTSRYTKLGRPGPDAARLGIDRGPATTSPQARQRQGRQGGRLTQDQQFVVLRAARLHIAKRLAEPHEPAADPGEAACSTGHDDHLDQASWARATRTPPTTSRSSWRGQRPRLQGWAAQLR